jgi:hypothetical protein
MHDNVAVREYLSNIGFTSFLVGWAICSFLARKRGIQSGRLWISANVLRVSGTIIYTASVIFRFWV